MSQGITSVGQIDSWWDVDFESDLNKIVLSMSTPFWRLKAPGAIGIHSKVFELYSKAGAGEDVNDLVFEDVPIEAETSMGYNCNTVNVPIPTNSN